MHQWRILLDLDGTVAQNAGRKVAERQFGVSVSDDRGSTGLLETLGLSRDEFWAWWHANQDEIYGEATLLPDADVVLRTLKQAGAYIAVVTARRSSAEAVTTAWLDAHGIPHDTMIMDSDDKVAVARALALNVGFEDDPAHAVPLAEVMPMALIQNNKNQGQEINHPQIHRVTGWTEVLPWLVALAARTA